MNCPKCNSKNKSKYGKTKNGRQRNLCRDCGCTFSVKHQGASDKVKNDALDMYLEGLGLRAIGRLLGYSHVTIMNWIKEFGKKAEEEKEKVECGSVIEMDEVFTFVGKKKPPLDLDSSRQGEKKVRRLFLRNKGRKNRSTVME